MPGSTDGRAPALYHRLDRHFPLSEMARAAGAVPPRRPSSAASQSSQSSLGGDEAPRRRTRPSQSSASGGNGGGGGGSSGGGGGGSRRLSATVPAPRLEQRPGSENRARVRNPAQAPRHDQPQRDQRGRETAVVEQFQLGRPGEFEGPFGTEHVAHPPRVPPLELPFAAPGLCYSRTTLYAAYVGTAPGVLLALVDDRDRRVALELRAPSTGASAGPVGGPISASAARAQCIGTLTDSLGNVLLTLHGRYAQVPAVVGRGNRRSRRAHETKFIIVVANHWGEPLLSLLTSAATNGVRPGASVASAAAHLPSYTQRSRSQPHSGYDRTRNIGNADGSGYMDDIHGHPGVDAAYARRIAANNAASGFHDIPTFDDLTAPTARPSQSAPTFPDELRRGFSGLTIASGSSGGSGRGSGRGSGAVLAALPGVDAFAGELDAPNRPVESRPVISLLAAEDALRGTQCQDAIRNENGTELATVTRSPQGEQGSLSPKFGLVLQPGVDVTLMTAVVAAQSWLAEHKVS